MKRNTGALFVAAYDILSQIDFKFAVTSAMLHLNIAINYLLNNQYHLSKINEIISLLSFLT